MSTPITLPSLALALALGAPQSAPHVRVERRLGAMGTGLELVVEDSSRELALAASERAARAIESVERRLSTWSEGSELARLNRTPVGTALELSEELARELNAAREVWVLTAGAFDPSVGGWVRAWGLRSGGRLPAAEEIEAARVPGGFGALLLDGRSATRTALNLELEEGGFGKGAGLDAGVAALEDGSARGWIDLGGQVSTFGEFPEALAFGVADPSNREREVLRVRIRSGSLATSGNSERGVIVDGERLGHLIDPRTGRPAPDFGSLTVHAQSALCADALATGLFVLGPDAALEFARREPGVSVLVLETTGDDELRLRVAGDWLAEPEILDPRVRFRVQPSHSTPAKTIR